MTDPHEREFEELVVRYQGVVCAVAYAVLRDRARSEEVAQEAFLVAWQKLPALATPPKLPGWICGIARNLAANAARRRRETAMEIHTAADNSKSPLDTMLDLETEQQARDALASLRDRDREVVVLYYRGDGSIADVASTLGISESAAKQRLHRGRERLRAALASVETTLRHTRPGTAFTAACVAAYALHGGRATAATAASGSSKAIIAAVATAVAIGAAVFTPLARAVSPFAPSVAAGVEGTRPATQQPTPTARDAHAIVRPLAAEPRASLVDSIAAARAARLARSTPATPGAIDEDKTKVYDFAGNALDELNISVPADLTTLNKATLRYAIRSLQPLLLECYGAAYDSLARKDGNLAVVVTLVGEPEVGTVVESVELDGDAHFTSNPALSECVRETLMAIELLPLEQGGRVQIHYPFAVSGRRPTP